MGSVVRVGAYWGGTGPRGRRVDCNCSGAAVRWTGCGRRFSGGNGALRLRVRAGVARRLFSASEALSTAAGLARGGVGAILGGLM